MMDHLADAAIHVIFPALTFAIYYAGRALGVRWDR